MSLTDGFAPNKESKVIVHVDSQPVVQRRTNLHDYLEDHLNHYGPRSRARIQTLLVRWLKIWGDREWNPKNFLAAWDELKTETKWSNSTLVAVRGAISRFERWMVTMKYCDTHFADLIRTEAAQVKVRELVTYQEYMILQGIPRGNSRFNMPYVYHGLWMTGLCLADLCSLKWSNVNLDKRVLTINRQKTGTVSMIPLMADSAFLADLRYMYDRRKQTAGVWPSVNGVHYVDNDLAGLVIISKAEHIHRRHQQFLQIAKLRDIKLHDFRATYITHALSVGDPVNLSMVTGHLDPKSLKAYATPQLDILTEISAAATQRAQQS